MFKVLMVDVDGVLVTGRPEDGKPPFTNAYRDLGLDPELLSSRFFAPHWADIVTGRKPIEPALADVLGEIAPHLGVEDVLRYWFENDSRLNEPLLADLEMLRATGVKIHLATNQEHRRAAWLMAHPVLKDRFDGIFYSADLGHKKPGAEFFAIATRRAGVEPAEIAFVDDAAQNVEAARNAGWAAVQWFAQTRLEEALVAAAAQRQ